MQNLNIEINRRSVQIVGLILLGSILLVAVYYLRSIFNPLLIALLLAYMLNPLVNKLERRKVPRTITIFGIYVLLTAAIVIIFLILFPLLASEVDTLYQKMFVGEQQHPSYMSTIIEKSKSTLLTWNARHPKQKIEIGTIPKEKLVQKIFQYSGSTLKTALKTLLSIFAILSYLVFLPLYTFFAIRGINNMWEMVESYFPPSKKARILYVLGRIHRSVSAFFRGKLIICLIKGFITWGCLELMGVKFALIFAGIQTMASIIPFLVLIVGMLPNLLLILVDIGISWPYLLGIIIMYGIIECLEGFLLTPWIMGKETGLHPLSVILALMIGGKLLGFFGLLIAIPLANILKILSQELVLPHMKEVLMEGERPEKSLPLESSRKGPPPKTPGNQS